MRHHETSSRTPEPVETTYRRRARTWSREIILAVALTIAALAFSAYALLGAERAPGMPLAAADGGTAPH
ncbi:MAG: hypothetical protein AB7K67_10270 [Hyphomicrobiaceae bacterium]